MKSKDILVFTLGAIVGTLGGIILAPSSGKSTLDRLTNILKKQKPTNELSNRELYKLSEITDKGIEQLEKLRSS